jgi:hypothetical protein
MPSRRATWKARKLGKSTKNVRTMRKLPADLIGAASPQLRIWTKMRMIVDGEI